MKPDTRKTTYTKLHTETMTAPKVVFGTTALKWIHALVDEHTTEVGFYAIVDERGDGEDKSYFVRDVFYPKHSEMNGATCEISPEGETDMIMWLCDHGREADIEKVRFWGHSHCNMGTTPSGQDESQALERMAQTQAYLIRAIANKSGEMSVSFFDFNSQIRFDNINWEKEDDIGTDIVAEKIANIHGILGNDEIDPRDKLLDIYRLIMADEQAEKIIAKVKELKKENEPRRTSMVTHVGRGGGGHQTSLFPGGPGIDPRNRWGEEDYATHYGERFPTGDLISDEEVDAMVEDWHKSETAAGSH